MTAERRLLGKEDILQSTMLRQETVHCPEWGGEVLVREMTAAERDEYEGSLMEAKRVGKKTQMKPNFTNAKARMAVKCMIDEQGKRMFSDAEAKKLANHSSSAIHRITEVIERLSGMSEEDVEELEQGFTKDQTDDSSSS